MLITSYMLSYELASEVRMPRSVLQMRKLRFFPKIIINFPKITQIVMIDPDFKCSSVLLQSTFSGYYIAAFYVINIGTQKISDPQIIHDF